MKNKRMTLVALTMIASIASVFGALILHSMLQVPSQIDVTESPYKLFLATDSLATIEATEIEFADFTDSLSDTGNTVQSPTYYMRSLFPDTAVVATWNATINGNFTISAEYDSGSGWTLWDTSSINLGADVIVSVRWDVTKVGTLELGTYAFTINLLGNEWV